MVSSLSDNVAHCYSCDVQHIIKYNTFLIRVVCCVSWRFLLCCPLVLELEFRLSRLLHKWSCVVFFWGSHSLRNAVHALNDALDRKFPALLRETDYIWENSKCNKVEHVTFNHLCVPHNFTSSQSHLSVSFHLFPPGKPRRVFECWIHYHNSIPFLMFLFQSNCLSSFIIYLLVASVPTNAQKCPNSLL